MSEQLFDKAAALCEGISALAQLRDLRYYARRAISERCGNCTHWMASNDCPREHNVNGMNRGPSSDDPGCDKFELKQSAAALGKKLSD